MSEKSLHQITTDPLTADLITFTSIVEASASTAGEADNWMRPANYAVQGLQDGWSALVSPEGQTTMPELRSRVSAYISTLGLSIEDASIHRLPSGTIFRLSPLILKELYGAQPPERQWKGFIVEVDSDVSALGTLFSSKWGEGKAILAGMRSVLGTNKTTKPPS